MTLSLKKYVDVQNSKQDIAINDKANKADVILHDDSRQMSGNLNMEGNALINVKPFVEDDNINQSGQAIDFSYFHAQRGELRRLINALASESLPVDGSDSVTGNLNMDNNRINNLSTDAADVLSAANVRYVNQAKAETVSELTLSLNKKINESHISSSTDKKDVFRYIMEDVDESASENNIIVNGIREFPVSPHDVNKKAYSFKMGKGAQNWYSSRLSFNMYKLPEGVVHFGD